MSRTSPLALAFALASVLAACAPDPRVGERLPGGGAVPGTFSSIAENVLVPRCATTACHSGNPPPTAPTSLDRELAYGQLVDVASMQAPALMLVEPGAPERSYLVLKLRGTAGDAGGVPTPMPTGDTLLDEAEIQAIEAWIAVGAPND
ncbi:conserved hypothetical protein [Anaeromyxobacter sp. K]|uniref:hypothetical protein n=1 Tax=Anaeromyxobacter sp. (strain K) TaxID=447217 RepID=UPI00017BE33A|nr:hypothetical protein [Anaeromyxobacter sp. K]ACG72206.1 conserved hypothetical protein [Anaeromyxobacter sp. K]